ncbi:RNA polymerase sigma factor [Pedobacter sp.]|jgi:RNA polymerase sigma factor (sigma-70 family)|uniref:RNA polymerase sigma factor n=1 Tax=Pedobacter sp. TaxID=1411316 RepID=UPI002CA0C345|nr:RNA polymerase sigma factor [Pedobacter sp.]HWW40401.1 RNA polymerase sigma factor [Pedobacter sp.]
MMEELSDTELWASFKSGDKNAFKTIYYRYYMMLYKYGLKTSSDSELAEDCLQDLFLKLWKNKITLGEVASVKSYLFRSYTHTLFDAVKKVKRVYNGADLNLEESDKSIEESIITDQSASETNHHLHQALKHLTKRQKQIIILHYFEGLSYKQIEEILPLKYQAIRNCVHEAIKILRKSINSRSFDILQFISYLYLLS